METSTVSRLGAAIILGVSIIFVGWWSGNAYLEAHRTDRSISVTGSAERIVVSDVAKWTISFSRSTDEMSLRAGNVALLDDLKKIKTYLVSKGVKEEELTIQVPALSIVCGSENGQSGISYNGGGQYCTTKLLGYNLSQSVVIESKDVNTVTTLSHEAMRVLSDQGLLINGNSVEYYLQSLPVIKLEMLGEATQNAQFRAKKIADSTGAQIGRIESANMGVFQVTPVNSTDISDYGTYDTSSLRKKVTAIVRTDFLLE